MTSFVRDVGIRAFLAALGMSLASVGSIVPGTAQADPAPVPTPTVSLPPDAGALFNQSPVDPGDYGLSEEEFFFEGSTSLGPYKSRMIVRRPLKAKHFNGTVIVEWMNASSGNDIDVDWLSLLPIVAGQGYAYVAVTSQQVTVNFLAGWDPARYGSLNMAENPAAGQPAAFEVFSQAGAALLDNGNGVDPLSGLRAKRLIAIGQSQSSGRLTTMVSTVHGVTLEPVYDAYVPHAGGGAPTAFPVPVFKLNSENEAPGYFGSRGVSDPNYRYWEVPGTAHQPLEGTDYAIDLLTLVRGSFPICPFPYEGPGGPVPIDPVLRAAVVHLDLWIRTGHAPPQAPLIEMAPSPTNPNSGVIQRDAFGNARGGIRMPQQQVPTARNTPSFGCFVTLPNGVMIPLATFPQFDAFDGGNDPAVDPTDTVNASEPASTKAVYKTHGRYVAKFTVAALHAAHDGYIQWSDALRMIFEAATSDIAK